MKDTIYSTQFIHYIQYISESNILYQSFRCCAEFESRAADLRKNQLCKNVLHKEMYLTSQTLEGDYFEAQYHCKTLVNLILLVFIDSLFSIEIHNNAQCSPVHFSNKINKSGT